MGENRTIFDELPAECPVPAEPSGSAPGESDDFCRLARREETDPARLHGEVMQKVRNLFSTFGATYLSEDRVFALSCAAIAVLECEPGSVTAVPIIPGGGKSTLIRAILIVFARVFTEPDTPIARRLGGVIIVVEKSAEGHELMELCNNTAGMEVATVIESVNDNSLQVYGCMNGTATCFEECLRRDCPNYQECPVISAAGNTQETPILILLHARYGRFMEDMRPFLSWYCEDELRTRSLLLVDELPNLFDMQELSTRFVNDVESDIDELPYQRDGMGKVHAKFLWNTVLQHPVKSFANQQGKKGLRSGLTPNFFDKEKMHELAATVDGLMPGSGLGKLVRNLIDAKNLYYTFEERTFMSAPRLRKIGGSGQPATVIFSGTATLAPEIVRNSEIRLVESAFQRDYSGLEIHIQRSDLFSISKTAMQNGKNFQVVVSWLRHYIPLLREKHGKILLVTYKSLSVRLYQELREFREVLIPYLTETGEPVEQLPYFGGMNGSNRYQEATCVIVAGLNRFPPSEYLSRAIALDDSGDLQRAIEAASERKPAKRSEQLPQVMDIQNYALANDLVQLLFRSKLRQHEEACGIECWLFQLPDGVVRHLQGFFPGAEFDEVRDLPDACTSAAHMSRTYRGRPTSAARLLQWLESWNGEAVTPDEIREQANLTQSQFKEAKKHPSVKKFFHDCVQVFGSGRNTVYKLVF